MRPGAREHVIVAMFVGLVLIPVALQAIGRKPLTQTRTVSELHNLACLFPDKPEAWNSYYVQVRAEGEREFQILDVSGLFPMQPFGHRTRLHRFFAAWGRRPSPDQTLDVARYIDNRWSEAFPDRPRPVEIRFARAWSFNGEIEFEGAWVAPPWGSVPAHRRRVVATHTREELNQ